MRARVVAILLLAVVGGLALWSGRPPAPEPANAPPTTFSADRAMPIVDDLAREPHPLGSPAAARVRDDAVARLRSLGLTTRIDVTAAARGGSGEVRAAAVDNVVATLPGTAPTGTVVLAAHTDSVAAGPGAADDTSSVAAILETVRALRAGPPLRDDVVVLLTDGEEAGLFGARAWVRDHLARDRPTVVLNHEARGVAGPSLIFQTSPGDAGLVRAIADAVPHPRGDSSQVAIYRLLPNDTDLSEVLDAGRPGVNSAFIERPSEYHTAGDSPAALSRASVQSQGSTMLALARALGSSDLRPLDPIASGLPPRPDEVWFRFLGVLVTYPQSWGLPIALVGAAVLVGVVVLARRRGLLGVPGVVVAAASALLAVAAAAGLGAALWALLVALRPEYADIGPFLGRPGPYEVADAALAVAVVVAWWLLVRRRVGALATAAGAAALLVVLGIVTAVVVPGASFLFAVPGLGSALGLGAAVLLRARPVVAVVAVALGTVPAVVLLLPFGLDLFLVAGVSGGLAAAGLALCACACVSVFWDGNARTLRKAPGRAWLLPGAALAVVVVSTGAGFVVDRPDAAHPQASHLAYLLDADADTARWVTRDTAPAPWTARYADGPPTTVDLGTGATTARSGPAPRLGVPAPSATVVERDPTRLVLALASPRGARGLTLRTDVPVTSATITYPGRPLVVASPGEPTPSRITLDAVPPEGVRLELTLARPGPVGIELDDSSDGLGVVPGFVPRPPSCAGPRSPTATRSSSPGAFAPSARACVSVYQHGNTRTLSTGLA